MSDRSRFSLDKYCYEKSIDILAIQESFTSNEENLNLKFMSHLQDYNESANRGAMIYVNSKKLNMSPLPKISEGYKNIDSVWGIVTGKAFRFIIGSVYLKLNYKNAVSDLLGMLERAKSLSAQLKAEGVITFGDFNARHQMWGDNTENSYGKQLVNELNFRDYTIMSSIKPTFLSDNGNSLIDFVITSTGSDHLLSDVKTDAAVELFSGAPIRGHVPIMTEYKVSCGPKITYPPQLKIDITSINWTSWKNEIDQTLSRQLIDFCELEPIKQWEAINNAIHDSTAKFATLKKSTKHSKPYWTDQLTVMSLALRKAKKIYQQRNTLSNKAALDEAKESFDKTRKSECQKFLLDKTANLNTAQASKFWKEFNSLFSKKCPNKMEHLKNKKDELLTEPEDIEEMLFSSFFEGKHLQEKGQHFDKTFYEEVNRIYEMCLISHNNSCGQYSASMDTQSTSSFIEQLNDEIREPELLFYINQYVTAGKSFDNSEFHPAMLKKLGPVAIKCIVSLFNSCFQSGQWVWDMADVIFLKKEGKKDFSSAGSYRPISITSYIGKVFEQIIAGRLEKYFSQIGLHDEKQEGFTKRRNTIRYLNRLDSDIRGHLKKKLTVICLFIDFEKAFDSVWKKGLMKKLYDHGVSGNVWKLINSFLFSRKVKLIFNDFIGLIRACREFGLPQGSALSPILFKFYIHDLAQTLSENENVETFKFADDGTFRVVGETTSKCLENLKLTCDTVYIWSAQWRMIINCEPGKTELIAFGTAENDTTLIPASFNLGCNEILFVEKTKVLGLIMDKKLSYHEHAKAINRKIQGRWASICKYTNRNWGFKQHIIVRLIEVLLYTRLHYAGTIWINSHSLKEVESGWYRPIKAALGAVFHVKQSVAEAILGVPPILVSNKVNSIKHVLKVNILPRQRDPLKKLIDEQVSRGHYSLLTGKIKDAFQFLDWKLSEYPMHFSKDEELIIKSKDYSKFSTLSTKCCSYTKSLMKSFTEKIWQQSMNSQFQLEGFAESPTVSTTKLKFDLKLSRQHETLFLSFFYTNNIMNEFFVQI